jgi:hypothetical protein
MCFSPFLWPKTFSQAAREPHVGASDYPRRVAPYFHFAMTDRYARPSAFAEAGPNPAKPPQRSSPTAARAMDPRCAWLDPGANESTPPSGGFFGRANRLDDTARSDLFNGTARHGPAATASTIAMATPGRCQLRRRTCKVTSGGQLRRTGRMLVPAPTEV